MSTWAERLLPVCCCRTWCEEGGGGAPAIDQVAAQHPQYTIRAEQSFGTVLEADDPDHGGRERLIVAARDWDGIHLSIAGYITATGFAIPAAGATTVLAGWGPQEPSAV
jgi:hypothetical protein